MEMDYCIGGLIVIGSLLWLVLGLIYLRKK